MSKQTANSESWADLLAAGDWDALLLSAGRTQDVDELRDLWALADEFAPESRRAGIKRRIEALGRAAAKTAARLAKEQGLEPPAASRAGRAAGPRRSSTTAAKSVTTSTPAAQVGGFRIDDRDEFANFAAAVRGELVNDKRPDVTDEQLAAALAAWHQVLQVEGEPLRFVSWPGWTSLCLCMWLADRYPRRSRPVAVPADSRVWDLSRSSNKIVAVSWLDPSNSPALGTLLVELDVNAQFLAAMRSALLGDGDPIELDADAIAGWDLLGLLKLPGYVVLAAPPDLTGLPPHAAAAFDRARAGTILPTPLAVYLARDHKVQLQLAEAVVWHTCDETNPRTGKVEQVPAYGKRMSLFAEHVEKGRAALMAAGAAEDDEHPANLAALLVKRLYSQMMALLRSHKHNVDARTGEPTGWLRPDWYDQIIATASANLLRALDKAYKQGWHVHGCLRDSVWLTAAALVTVDGVTLPARTDANGALIPLAGMEISSNPGKWKITRRATVTDDVVTAFGRRRPQTFRKAVAAAAVAA